jgi:hypothetical protein
MLEHTSTIREVDRQLAELLADPGYARVFRLLTGEVRRRWQMGLRDARRIVLSAIGDPVALASIYAATMQARDAGRKPVLAGVISRRRVIDLLRKDAARPRHRPLPIGQQEIERDPGFRTLSTSGDDAPDVQIQRSQAGEYVRRTLASFAEQGLDCARQANLLRRRVFDGASYQELAVELGCNENALRGRFCAAKKAFRQFLKDRDPARRNAVALWGR